jgi:hypothetical protein
LSSSGGFQNQVNDMVSLVLSIMFYILGWHPGP